jgi:hypothetical protein
MKKLSIMNTVKFNLRWITREPPMLIMATAGGLAQVTITLELRTLSFSTKKIKTKTSLKK